MTHTRVYVLTVRQAGDFEGQMTTLDFSPLGRCSSFVFHKGPVPGLELTAWVRLAGWRATGIPLSLPV